MFYKKIVSVVSLSIFLTFVAQCNAAPRVGKRATLTQATDAQRLDINQLIQHVEFASVVLNDRISTYATFQGRATRQTYRLDNERPTRDGFAKFRIQSGSETYGAVLIQPNVNFGVSTIRNAFIRSVLNTEIVRLQ